MQGLLATLRLIPIEFQYLSGYAEFSELCCKNNEIGFLDCVDVSLHSSIDRSGNEAGGILEVKVGQAKAKRCPVFVRLCILNGNRGVPGQRAAGKQRFGEHGQRIDFTHLNACVMDRFEVEMVKPISRCVWSNTVEKALTDVAKC